MKNKDLTLKEHIEKSKTNVGSFKVEGYLTITLKKAVDLIPCDVTGKSDPYVYLAISPSKDDITKVYPKTAKSEIKKQTLNPVFDETFSLPVANIIQDVLIIEMWDWDRIGDDDFMGQIKVKLSETGVTKRDMVSLSLTLDKVDSGKVDLDLSFSYSPVPEFNAVIDKYLKQYQFIISSVITNDLTHDKYKKYLRLRKSEESASFVEKILHFKSLFQPSERYYKANEIITTHVENNAPQQVVLLQGVRKEILDKQNQSSESECDVRMFDKALEHQVKVLKEDLHFDEFLRTREFLHVLADNWRSLIPMIATSDGEDKSLVNVLKEIYGDRDEESLLVRMKKELKVK
jgi:hypothetical protein